VVVDVARNIIDSSPAFTLMYSRRRPTDPAGRSPPAPHTARLKEVFDQLHLSPGESHPLFLRPDEQDRPCGSVLANRRRSWALQHQSSEACSPRGPAYR